MYFDTVFMILINSLLIHMQGNNDIKDEVDRALEYVYHVNKNSCSEGTKEVLYLNVDYSLWNLYTDPAIRTANLLSEYLVHGNGSLGFLTDEFFFMLVRNNVHGNSMIFGSAIALEPGVYRLFTKCASVYAQYNRVVRRQPLGHRSGLYHMRVLKTISTLTGNNLQSESKYPTFCPYAFREKNTVKSHDIAINYNYLDPTTEWYYQTKMKIRENITVTTDVISYRENNSLLPEITVTIPLASLRDGHWTYPYFNCGGGDVWMVSYSTPIFFIDNQNETPKFRGLAGIDIEMTNIDINQCDTDHTNNQSDVNTVDLFRGTHKCAATTRCVPKRGLGFKTGAYDCYCEDGYYFPHANVAPKAFHGTEVEEYFRYHKNLDQTLFMCVKCAPGCDTCVDGSPCLHQSSEIIRLLTMMLMSFTIAAICVVSGITFVYRKHQVIKTASPLFLHLMCLGGILLCFEYFAFCLEVSLVVCNVRIWPHHLGFFIMYGSLIMKTWRISVIFSIGTTKRIHLPDQSLIQRFCVIGVIAFCLLMTWTFASPPTIETIKTDDKLKFFVCSYGAWEYAFAGVEVLFLLYGGYLCYTVRKVPAYFNESKHITWSIYNAIILGTFIALVTRFILTGSGPDMLYLLNFIQIQVYVTVTMTFIFVPKFWAIYKNVDIGETSHSASIGMHTITDRLRQTQVFPHPDQPDSKQTMTTGTQTSFI